MRFSQYSRFTLAQPRYPPTMVFSLKFCKIFRDRKGVNLEFIFLTFSCLTTLQKSSQWKLNSSQQKNIVLSKENVFLLIKKGKHFFFFSIHLFSQITISLCSFSPCSFVLSVFLCVRLFGGEGGKVVQPETRLTLVRWLANAALYFCLVCFSSRPLVFSVFSLGFCLWFSYDFSPVPVAVFFLCSSPLCLCSALPFIEPESLPL